MPKVSVIMPCLNMVQYIEESLDSVIGQTLEDIEVLVIDAGSTDGTLDTIEKYVHKDNRIKLIHSEKKSYGYQVNLGIGESSGEYIGIVDTDDRIVPDMYEILYKVSVRTGADYVKGTVDYFYTINEKYTYYQRLMQFQEEEYEEGRIEVIPKDMPEILLKDAFIWYGIYKSEFFKKIRFHESSGAAYQDLGGLLQTQMNAGKAVYIEKAVYKYRQDNMRASGYNPKAFDFIVGEYDWCEAFLQGKSEEWHTAFYCKFFSHIVSRFEVMSNLGSFWKGAEDAMKKIRHKLSYAIEKGIITEKNFETWQWKYLQLFLESPEALYEEIERRKRPDRQALSDILKTIRGKHVVIFGGGQMGVFLYLLLLNNHAENVVAFCDNNKSLKSTTLYELNILRPEDAVSMYSDAVFIIANRKNAVEMQNQIIQLGIKVENIIVFRVQRAISLFNESFV